MKVHAVSVDERNGAAAGRSIDLALTAGGMMLEGGASAASVAVAMRDIATAAGLGDVTADVNHSVLTMSEHGTPHVGTAAISSRTYDFGRLRDTTRVVKDLCAKRIDLTTARRQLDSIGEAPERNTTWSRLLASGAAGASWAVVFGADPVVTISAFVVNSVLALVHTSLTLIGWPLFFVQIIAGIVAVAVAATVAVFHPHTDASLTVTSVIVLLLPGVAFIGGIKDAISGWYLTAIARLAESITAVVGLIVGIQLALTAAAYAGIHLEVAPPKAINLTSTPTTLIASGAIAVFFGIVSRNSPKTLAASAILSAAGLTVYTGALSDHLSSNWATATAATTIGALATAIGTLDCTPTLAITTPAMLALLPGITLYRGMFYGGSHIHNAVMLALALASGLTAGEYVTTTLRTMRINRPRHTRETHEYSDTERGPATVSLNRRLLEPKRWTPPPAPPNQGRTAATRAFTVTRRIATGGTGPEDVIFDQDGHVLTGLEDGNVVRFDLSTGHHTVIGNTGGRPLGLEPGRDGAVLICDHDKGLLRMSADGSVEVLVDTVAEAPLTFASNVVEAPDGTIWFTVSSRRWDAEHFLGEFLEHSCTGLVVRRDLDGMVTVVCDHLKFSNGLVLAPDGSHLLFAESAGYRISRYWLTGPKAETIEPFQTNLPGLPDNMSLGSDQLVWVSIVARRNALLDFLLPRPGFLRTLVWNLIAPWLEKAAPIAWVMAFDLNGDLIHDLRSDDGSYDFVTSVAERNGIVVAGSLQADDVVTIKLPSS